MPNASGKMNSRLSTVSAAASGDAGGAGRNSSTAAAVPMIAAGTEAAMPPMYSAARARWKSTGLVRSIATMPSRMRLAISQSDPAQASVPVRKPMIRYAFMASQS